MLNKNQESPLGIKTKNKSKSEVYLLNIRKIKLIHTTAIMLQPATNAVHCD